jgi:hypothetical protein
VADGAHRSSRGPEARDSLLQLAIAEVLTHARRVTSGQQQPVERAGVGVTPGERAAKLGGLLELAVEGDWLRIRPELAEQDPGEQERIGRWCGAAVLGREGHRVACSSEELPGDRYLGDVEVAVGQGDEDACQGGPAVA